MRWVLRAVVVLVLTGTLTACLSGGDSCACQYPDESARYDVYLMTGFGADASLSPMEIRDDSGREPAVVAVTSLLHTTPPPDAELVNGWAPFEEPIAEVLSVSHPAGEVVVDLDRDMMDPFPTRTTSLVPDGLVTVQQLVWTVQQALGTDDPVRVTVRGRPTPGVWLTPVRWPVRADTRVLAPTSAAPPS